MSERMEVEVIRNCQHCGGLGTTHYTWTKTPSPDTCIQCDGTGKSVAWMPVKEGTRTEALLRLAEAELADSAAYEAYMASFNGTRCDPDLRAAWLTLSAAKDEALARLRAFDQGEGKDAAD